MTLPDRDVLDGIHQLRNSDVLRTSFEASVARRAEPDEWAGENLLLHTEKGHPDDSSRIVSIRHLPHRAPRGTGSAGETLLDVFSSGLGGNEKLKLGVKRLGIDHRISSANNQTS